ncbi:MAG: 16S rRNA (guanine(966)-N(2))-methyltransferase RsmD [Pseudomonadales bacterium]|nr:16S rRNA (guanine(966)-N(2))-methyltransferase RsmD [Pseudomonadales bacterium]
MKPRSKRSQKPRKANKTAPAAAAQPLRIIGGQWRGRKLNFTPAEGLRPTLDRFREVLFNWLMFDIEGAACLDLFAGSGALGLESLSRGAKQVTFVDLSKACCQQINSHLELLQCQHADVYCDNGMHWLEQTKQQFDVVFLDPPFHKALLDDCLARLLNNGYIKSGGYIYIEAENSYQLPTLPDHWQLHRHKLTKNNVFFLLKKSFEI